VLDLHSHVLPGVDDGPAALSGSREILDAAIADGITHIAATPHVRSDWPTKPDVMERLVADVRALGAPIEVLPGGELDLHYLETLDDETLRRFGLGGNPNLLLLEFPYAGWPLQLRELVFQLEMRGFGTVLAHPERNPEVQEEPDRLRELVDAGVAVQLTAASLDGRLGRRTAGAARELLDSGLAHLIASDAHMPSIRSVGMTAAADAIGDRALAQWLTHDVPHALLASQSLPDRPQRHRRTMRLPWHK
jgi:protein-tyrosine phosphatase